MHNIFKSKEVRRWGISAAIVMVTLLFAGQIILSSTTNGTALKTEGKVVSVVAAETVETSGLLEAQPFAALTWNTSGVVEEVNVKAGDVLMRLNAASVDASVLSARSNLIAAQKDLENLLISFHASDRLERR